MCSARWWTGAPASHARPSAFSRRSAIRSIGMPSPMPGATEYQPAMDEVRSGRIPFCKLDVLHRHNLERILPRFGISGCRRTWRATSISHGIASMLGPTCRLGWRGSSNASGSRRSRTAISR